MKADQYHLAMRPLEEACERAQSDWVCLSNPVVGWGEEGSTAWKLGIFFRHVLLVFRCWGVCRRRHVLIREFSSIPLLLVFPFLWLLRKKLFFLIHHNVQWAVRNRVERFGLMMLSRMGTRWAILETQNLQRLEENKGAGSACLQGLEKYNIPSEANLVLPHPCEAMRQKSGRASLSERAVIGVVGHYRAEKGMDELVGTLKKMNGCRDSRLPEFGILLGVPNPDAVEHLDVEVVDTSTEKAYREMISRCDVLVFNNRSNGYFYRASGPVADAAACRTAVVVPDFPTLGKQVEGMGEVFQGLENMPEAVRRALEKTENGEYDFETYCMERSVQALAEHLDDFSDGKN